MKFLIVIIAAIEIASAVPGDEQIVSVSHDTLGNYNLKYAIAGSSRVEQRDAVGNVIGAYSFIDPHGILRKTEYTAGVHGFNAVGTDIPLPVVDTPEVAAAKSSHIALLRAAELAPKVVEVAPAVKVAEVPIATPVLRTVPLVHLGAIPETPEVLAARAEHLAAHEAARKLLIVKA